ncbi:MAG: hypothetical protein LBJ04_10820 [Sphingobacterium sp.]|jgi:hypothetical protein|nr:hypothetical protein [Sphingobacterium sp.]
MDEKNIYDLFYSGQLDLFIIEGENQLKQNDQDVTLWTHLAIAYHDQVFYDGHEAIFDIVQEKMLPYFQNALTIEPENETTLYHILNYTLDNQAVLAQIGRPKLHITETNKDQFIDYAKKLIASPNMSGYGHNYLVNIYEGLQDDTAMLPALEAGINFVKEAFKDERETLDHNFSILWIKKIYLLDRTKQINETNVSSLIEADFKHFISSNEMNYVDLAEIAYENKAIDLALRILLKLIKGENSAVHIHQELVKWHARFEELIAEGYENPEVFYYQLIIERNYSEEIGIPLDYYYLHALKLIDEYPDSYAGYHFAAAYLYDEEQYAAAIPYLQMVGEKQSNTTSWRRLVECSYKTNAVVYDQIPLFRDLPRECYNEAVALSNFVHSLDNLTAADQSALQALILGLYRQAYNAFNDYFEEDKYESDYFGGNHNRAMNCNNLALAYKEAGDFESCYTIATEGLSYSDFEELHFTRADAMSALEDYVRLEEVLQQYFDTYQISLEATLEQSEFAAEEDQEDENTEPVIFPPCYRMLTHQIDVEYHLQRTADIQSRAQQLLEFIYRFYIDNPNLDDYHYRDFEATKNAIENIVYHIIEQDHLEQRISYYQDMAQKYPHEAQPQYVLMQLYNEQSNYKAMNTAAYKYLKNKREFIIDSFDKAKTLYLIIKSHYYIKEFDAGTDTFQTYDNWVQSVMEPNDYVLWLKFGIELLAENGSINELNKYTSIFNSIYTQYDWGYDDDVESVRLAEALANYKTANLKKAHSLLDEVLAYSDHSPLADEYKRTWKKPGFFSGFKF